ncbi:MBL fold metallo-hydrolase [Novosphingobium flavum]|uniref:beta-lactamase n=1 Tax=Novosphingobium aerophilum TaxID=2839843 RepID=A0A7X1KDP7_9SPHN|nr:MBL fold metallo-hydrolase [Novosphingobium aerophilum]MBC2663361.1 MBL fold metallo-hydrolase [Novosphingobium aerophilum]
MRRVLPALAVSTLLLGSAGASLHAAAPSDYPAQATFPEANPKALARHLSAARKWAEPDLLPEFYWRCMTSPLDRKTVFAIQHDGLVQEAKVFDQLYSIGQNAVSAWALDTSDGIILIDALNNEAEARDILVPNMVRLGLDPKRIKILIVTHGHGDHWGGAKYLQDTFGARVALSEADWKMLESPDRGGGPFRDLVPPRRDMVVRDGDTITLGKTSVRLFVTPGHTPGTLSLMFPVTDKGRPHVVALMGGTGGGTTGPAVHDQIASLQRWNGLTGKAGVDALISNHPAHIAAIEKIQLLTHGDPADSNPFVYGKDRAQRFSKVMEACSRVQLARMGESGD